MENLRLTLAYLATIYHVEAGHTVIPFKVNHANKEMADLMRHHGVREAAFITACNPGSQHASEAQNLQAMQMLVGKIKRQGYSYLTGLGADPAGQWLAEPSLFILGMPDNEAGCLGKEFGQNAILHIDATGYAELVSLWR